jgi:hypothetical protein
VTLFENIEEKEYFPVVEVLGEICLAKRLRSG